jgi:hypothetical protein
MLGSLSEHPKISPWEIAISSTITKEGAITILNSKETTITSEEGIEGTLDDEKLILNVHRIS